MKKRTAAAFTAAALTVLIIVGCIIAPSFSRPNNTNSWTGEVKTETSIQIRPGIKSNLLSKTPNDQTVIINKQDDEIQVNIGFESFGGCADDTGSVSITVQGGEADWNEPQSAASVTVESDKTASLIITLTPQTADPADLIFSVSVDFDREDDLSALFKVTTQNASPRGKITECTEFYGKNIPVVLSTENKTLISYDDCSGAAKKFFPAMTKYTDFYSDGSSKTVILYDGGYIETADDATVVIDFSSVSPAQQFWLYAGGSSYNLELSELPKLPDNIGSPVILNTENKEILSVYELAVYEPEDTKPIEPEVVVQRLTKNESDFAEWQNDTKITLEKASNGSNTAVLKRNEADPGTYRIFVSWTYKGVVIYERSVIFYVQRPFI